MEAEACTGISSRHSRERAGAIDLTPGMWLLASEGTLVQVTGAQEWTQPATVHNLTVQDIHTYYVLSGVTPVVGHDFPVARNRHHLPTTQEAQDMIQNAPRGSSAVENSDPFHRASVFIQDQIAERGEMRHQAQRGP